MPSRMSRFHGEAHRDSSLSRHAHVFSACTSSCRATWCSTRSEDPFHRHTVSMSPGNAASHRRIRPCSCSDDAVHIHRLIHALAVYERDADSMVMGPEDFARDLNKKFSAALAEVSDDGDKWRSVGVALYFESYSSWTGPCLYLEDIFVEPDARGSGLGTLLMKHCAEEAVKRGCSRLQWVVLDWNKPSIEFYKAAGARDLSEWKVMRLEGEALTKYASST